MSQYSIDMVVANDVNAVTRTATKAILILKSGDIIKHEGTKRELAHHIFDAVTRVR